MVDLAELQRSGKIPKNPDNIPTTDRRGYIDLSRKSTTKIQDETPSQQESPGSVFGFMESFSSSSSTPSFSTETDGYSKREVDRRLEQMDNKIYKLEQRLELLERKANINSY